MTREGLTLAMAVVKAGASGIGDGWGWDCYGGVGDGIGAEVRQGSVEMGKAGGGYLVLKRLCLQSPEELQGVRVSEVGGGGYNEWQ